MPVLDSAEHRTQRGLDCPLESWSVRVRRVANEKGAEVASATFRKVVRTLILIAYHASKGGQA